MKLRYYPYTLQLRHTFTLATSSRTTTPVVLVEIESDGLVGYGEASLPPYLPETQESVMQFLATLQLDSYTLATPMDNVLAAVMGSENRDCAAKAAVDIALHDIYGKAMGKAWWQEWGLSLDNLPHTSFTIGIDTPACMAEKTHEAAGFGLIKVKLGTPQDRESIAAIRSVSDAPICVDVNQGWSDKYEALDKLHWCKEQGVVFAEQPMPKHDDESMAWLHQHTPIPLIADESFQRLADLPRVASLFDGVNIKLMKCTGLHEAHQIANEAHRLGLKVMLGCMTETSCAISAAAQLSPLADWTDLDGNLLISNDCFRGATLSNGKVVPTTLAGIGVEKI